MKLTLCVLTAALANPTGQIESTPDKDQPFQPTAGTVVQFKERPTAAQVSSTNSDGSPKIVWHSGPAPANAIDGRKDIGNGIRVSMMIPDSLPSGTGPNGAIRVPDNTMGPGTPVGLVRDWENAMRHIAEAKSMYAQRQAEMARLNPDAFRYGDTTICLPDSPFDIRTPVWRDEFWTAQGRPADDRALARRSDRGDQEHAAERREATPHTPMQSLLEQEEAYKKAHPETPVQSPQPSPK